MNNFSDPVSLTKKLITIESTNPGCYESSVSSYILELLSTLPSSAGSIVTEEVLPGRFNIMSNISSNSPLPELVFICHMDTVPAGRGWLYPPFYAQESDQRIYGRGSCDMKSGLACALLTFMEAAILHKNQIPLSRGLRFIATVDEENQMRGVEQALRSSWIPDNSFILDTEPTNCTIQSGHKGRVWFHLTIQGTAAHASNPWKGADAIAGMSEVISYIRKHIRDLPADDYFGSSTVCFGTIQGGSCEYMVSDCCTVSIDMRLVPPASAEDAYHLIESGIYAAQKEIDGISGHIKVTGNRPSIPYYHDSEFLNALSASYFKTMHTKCSPSPFTGYTDSAVAAAVLKNKNCLSFGPGNLEHAHRPDEYVLISDILQCHAVLKALTEDLCFRPIQE